MNLKEFIKLTPSKKLNEASRGKEENTLFYGLAEVTIYKKSVVVSYGGNMGATEKDVEQDVNGTLKANAFKQLKAAGTFAKDSRGQIYNSPSYMYTFEVPRAKFDEIMSRAKKITPRNKIDDLVKDYKMSEAKEKMVYAVGIPANVYEGKYYEFSVAMIHVLASSKEEAIKLAILHKDEIIKYFSTVKMKNGKYRVARPTADNMFFNGTNGSNPVNKISYVEKPRPLSDFDLNSKKMFLVKEQGVTSVTEGAVLYNTDKDDIAMKKAFENAGCDQHQWEVWELAWEAARQHYNASIE